MFKMTTLSRIVSKSAMDRGIDYHGSGVENPTNKAGAEAAAQAAAVAISRSFGVPHSSDGNHTESSNLRMTNVDRMSEMTPTAMQSIAEGQSESLSQIIHEPMIESLVNHRTGYHDMSTEQSCNNANVLSHLNHSSITTSEVKASEKVRSSTVDEAQHLPSNSIAIQKHSYGNMVDRQRSRIAAHQQILEDKEIFENEFNEEVEAALKLEEEAYIDEAFEREQLQLKEDENIDEDDSGGGKEPLNMNSLARHIHAIGNRKRREEMRQRIRAEWTAQVI
jgi:hypothetical protein